jgi:hypothetical protein
MTFNEDRFSVELISSLLSAVNLSLRRVFLTFDDAIATASVRLTISDEVRSSMFPLFSSFSVTVDVDIPLFFK